jgi:hypothetical protein
MEKPDPIDMPIRFRPIDFIIFGLLMCILAWQAIQYGELESLRGTVHAIEMRGVR